MSELDVLLAPFILSILLVGMHAYLGLHVLKREVIFVDICLSQVAALGGALSLFFFHEDQHEFALVFSLALCLIVALFLSLLRMFEKKISQEVLIGITYAFASGSLILVMDLLPHGAEHLKEALVGNILFVTWRQVLETFLVYLVIGLIHFVYRHQFWATSSGKLKSFYWDFLFYLLFGIVISFSTHHAGVLVVFSILVVPAALASRLVQKTSRKLILAWTLGSLGVLLSFVLSQHFDLPPGASIVTCLTGLFFVFLFALNLLEKLKKA